MYNSGYSQVSKRSLDTQKKMQCRSKGKSCGYYMRIVFFFSSLIQSLIIVSLVLFLVYGKSQDSASTVRIQDLEESFSRLSLDNVALRQQRKNLTNLLNVTMTEKARNDWDLARFRYYANISALFIQDLEKKLQQFNIDLNLCKGSKPNRCDCDSITKGVVPANCGFMVERLNARIQLVESNFTHSMERMKMEMDQTAKERDYINLEAIHLRREKSTQEMELKFSRQKCKDDFSQSLSGVSNVTKAFLKKIDSLFPTHIAFQLTCPNQREHLEQIRTNCTSLSREVEDKFQRYLDNVGERLSDIQAENSRLKAENLRLSADYRWCTQNRTGLIQEHKQNLDKLQRKHDQDKERLLMDKMKLNGQIEVLDNNVKYKTKEVDHLMEQIKHLNMSCMSKTGLTSQPGWSLLGQNRLRSGGSGLSIGTSGSTFNKPGTTGTGSSSSSYLSLGSSPSLGSTGSGFNKPGTTGTGSSSSSFLSLGSSPSLGSTGSGFNKPVSTGTGSSRSSFLSLGSSPSLGSTGSGFNKPGSTGTGSSSSSFPSLGSSPSLSSTGSGFNKPVSAGGVFSSFGSVGSSPSLSSTGIGSNKPALSARGSSTIGSSSGSTGSSPNLSSSGIGSNKPTSSVKIPSSSGSSSGSTGSTSKTGSAFSWFGLGSSNSGQSKPGSGTGRGTSSGTSLSGPGVGRVSVTQHLQDLQRLINPSGSEEKQDLSRMLG